VDPECRGAGNDQDRAAPGEVRVDRPVEGLSISFPAGWSVLQIAGQGQAELRADTRAANTEPVLSVVAVGPVAADGTMTDICNVFWMVNEGMSASAVGELFRTAAMNETPGLHSAVGVEEVSLAPGPAFHVWFSSEVGHVGMFGVVLPAKIVVLTCVGAAEHPVMWQRIASTLEVRRDLPGSSDHAVPQRILDQSA
jgi:hypothetical protein